MNSSNSGTEENQRTQSMSRWWDNFMGEETVFFDSGSLWKWKDGAKFLG